MGTCFRRPDVYIAVAPKEEMVDTITEIILEVLKFIGIATEEIKQSSSQVTGRSGKDALDALERLAGLIQEKARMAAAQILKVTDTIDNRNDDDMPPELGRAKLIGVYKKSC